MRRSPRNNVWWTTGSRFWERFSIAGIRNRGIATRSIITNTSPKLPPARRCEHQRCMERPRAIWRGFELVASAAGLTVAAPVMAAVAAAIQAEDGGPVFFRQTRVGQNGAPFLLLKFRSMSTGQTGSAITAAGDRRVTRVGR